MIARVWTAYTVELTKALRLRFTYIGPLLIALVVFSFLPVRPIEKDGVSDYGFIALATPAALNVVGLLFILAYCGGLISSELGSGTVRFMLTRPLYRRDFILAKLAFGMSYALALGLFTAALSWGIVALMGDTAGVSYGGELIHSSRAMALAYLYAFLLGLAPLWAAVAYAVMISSLTRSPAAAIGAAVGLWFAVDLLKYPFRFAPFFFGTYLEAPWQRFAAHVENLPVAWAPDAYYWVGLSLVSGTVFVAVALLVMARRNLHS